MLLTGLITAGLTVGPAGKHALDVNVGNTSLRSRSRPRKLLMISLGFTSSSFVIARGLLHMFLDLIGSCSDR